MSCIVPGCSSKSRKDKSIQYFLFPKNLEHCQLWIQACKLVDAEIHLDEDVVCSLHFDENAYELVAVEVNGMITFSKTLKEDAIPSQNLPVVVNTEEEEKITIVYNDVKDPSTFNSVDSSLSQTKYNAIKNKVQLDEMKIANERLQKQITALKIELANKNKIYKEKLAENNAMKNELRKNTQNVYSKQRTKALLSKVFSQTQIQMLLGKKKTYWSDHDMAVGYTIRHLSNISCYTYLMKNMNIPLPGLSSIKRWINVKNLGKPRRKLTGSSQVKDNGEVQQENGEPSGRTEDEAENTTEFAEENEIYTTEDNEIYTTEDTSYFHNESEGNVDEIEQYTEDVEMFEDGNAQFIEYTEDSIEDME